MGNEEKSFTAWFYIHRVPTKKGQPHDFERPVGMTRFTRRNTATSGVNLGTSTSATMIAASTPTTNTRSISLWAASTWNTVARFQK